MKKKRLLFLLPHLLFCVVVILAFRYYSILRPAACGALYKEYITSLIVLFIYFLNIFILCPKLYFKRRFLNYILTILFISCIASLTEEMIVYRQIYEIVHNLDINVHQFFLGQIVLITIRNLCFLLFSFIIANIHHLIKERDEINQFLNNKHHLIIGKDTLNNTVTISIRDITYCQQVENYTYLILINGMKYYRNSSMSSLYKDLGTNCSVRISRNIIAMYSYIQTYNSEEVFILTHEGVKGFKITESYKERVLEQLGKHVVHPVTNINEISDEQKAIILEEKQEVNMETTPIEAKQTSELVLKYIQEHPNCKGGDITQYCKQSLRTVNRILAQLKKEGLIEYVGSKKTGGYKVVEG